MIAVIITTIICTLILSVCIGILIYSVATIPKKKTVCECIHPEGKCEILSISFAPINAAGEPDYEKAMKFTPDQLKEDKPYEQTAFIKW